MTKYYSDTIYAGGPAPRRKKPWLTFLKVMAWCAGILILLVVLALWIITAYFTPQHIKRLIEEESSKYLLADVNVGNLDYKIFSTYPWLYFEVDSLSIISKSLENINPEVRDSLPVNADFLASVVKLKGKINVHSLLSDKINIKQLEIVQPKANLVMVDDSITNFNIAPHIGKTKKIPELELSEVTIITPVGLSFFSLKDDAEGNMEVDSFSLVRTEPMKRESKPDYLITFDGRINGRYQNYSLPSDLPVKFKTDLSFDLPNIAVRMENLSLSLAGIAIDMKGNLKANPEGFDIEEANFNVRIEDIFTLMQYLPEEVLKLFTLPEGLTGNLPLDLSVSLTEPFHLRNKNIKKFSLSQVPPFTALLKIEDANLFYTPPKGKRLEADDIFLSLACDYNPADSTQSWIRLNELRMHGEGIALEGSALVGNPAGNLQPITGKVFFQSPLMESLSYLMPYLMPGSDLNLTGFLKGEISFSAEAVNLGKDGLKDITVSGDVLSHALRVKSKGVGTINLKNIDGEYKAVIPCYPLSNYAGTKLYFDFTADSINANTSGLNLLVKDLDLAIDAMDTVSGNPDPKGIITLSTKDIDIKQGGNRLQTQNLKLNVSGSLNSASSSNYTTVSATKGGDDALIASRVSHTPLTLVYEGGGILQTIMSMVRLNAEITLDKANFKSPAYLYPVDITDMKVATNLNNINYRISDVKLNNTSFSISGQMEGLKPFLTSYSATPLRAYADIDFDNVDINNLSRGYYGALVAQGKDSVFYIPPLLPLTAADSTCVAIPRNIEANVRLRAKSAEYMQYRFSPLSTDIIVDNGVATLSKLTVGTPYCTAIVDWTYSTAALDNIFMSLDAKIVDFSFSPFYKVFPDLVDKTPELRNFTGNINAGINCSFNMFPNMFMNSESLQARYDIKGSQLEFAREGKIERITHLMRIEGDEPIKIEDIAINGGFHDNVLQVNPFKISFGDYQLGIAGINNTAGDMYYHLALEKSPFHLPFGVTLSGKFSRPDVKLGGTHINDFKAEEVSIAPTKPLNVNIMAYLKNGWQIFVVEAAKYAQESQANKPKDKNSESNR